MIEAERKYWLARRQEVMDMSRHLNSPHLFFTLSDLRWADKYMQQKELKDGPTELFRRRNPARPSTYNATAHLDQRVRLFIKDFLAPSLGVVHFWYRYEWQEQRSAHVHGFLWLKDAPNFDEINWGLLKDENAAIYKGQDNKMRRFVDYWAPIISASKSIPLQNIPHIDDLPFSEPHETVKSTKKKISVLLNWVQRHTASKEDKLLAKRKTLGQEETPAPDHPEAVHAGNSDWSFSKPRPNRRSPNSYDLASIMRLANVDMKPVMSERALREYVTEYATKPKSALEILAGIAKSSADSKVLNKRLDGWVHSARETTHFLKGIPMVRCSVSFQTLNLGSDGGYWEPMLQEPDNGDEMEGVDFQENPLVSADSWLQRYMRRPPSMEEISLYDVMTKYRWENSKWRKKEDTTHVVLRVYPRFSPIPEDDRYDEYCRTKILLHHSFRNLATILKNEDQSWTGLYTRCRIANHKHPKDTLRSWEKEVRDAPIEKEDLEKPDPKDLLDILLSSKEVPMYVPEEIGQRPIDDGWDLEASRARWKYISEMPTWFEMKDKRYYRNEVTQDDLKSVNIDTLVPEQRKLLDVFTGTYAKILAGESPPQILMNIDGTAGCGKTYLIRAICQELRRMARENGQRDPIRVVAPTGVAALNISGRTINSAFCLPVNANAFMTLSGRKLMHQRLLWEGVHFVIFDEKSMIGSRVLAQVDYRVRQLLPREINKPFSNLNIALIGDFAQFQPVRDLPLYVPPSKSDDDLFHHGSFLYSLFKENHFLKTSHRQSGNSPERIQFRNMLRHVSEGGLSFDEWQTLITRCEDRLSPADRARFKNAMCLFAREVEVETVNLSRLVALNQPCARIMATHVGGPAAAEVDSNKAGLDRCVLLARGAKVMLTRNIWQEQGLEISNAFFLSIVLNLGVLF